MSAAASARNTASIRKRHRDARGRAAAPAHSQMGRGPARDLHLLDPGARPVLVGGGRGRTPMPRLLGMRGRLVHDQGAYALQAGQPAL